MDIYACREIGGRIVYCGVPCIDLMFNRGTVSHMIGILKSHP